MAFTVSNVVPGSCGDARTLSGTFTSAAGDATLTYTHGMLQIRLADFSLDPANIAPQIPSVSHSAGVATVTWDDTQGASGRFIIIGK
jgi:hypothetical protein